VVYYFLARSNFGTDEEENETMAKMVIQSRWIDYCFVKKFARVQM